MMKESVWNYHVPTSLQHLVAASVEAGEVRMLKGDEILEALLQEEREKEMAGATNSSIDSNDNAAEMSSMVTAREEEDEEEEEDEVEYQAGRDNLSVMNSMKNGVMRDDYVLDVAKAAEFEAKQKVDFRYTRIPKRIVAAVDLKGDDVKGKDISETLKLIKQAVQNPQARVRGRRIRLVNARSSAVAATTEHDRAIGELLPDSVFGLQIWGTKIGFNSAAEPSLAVYEMQYGSNVVRLFVEIELL